MSHFTVLVTKTNEKSIDDQLERFYEQGEESDYFMQKEIEVPHDGYDEYLEREVKSWTERLERDPSYQKYIDDAQAALDSDDVEVKREYIKRFEGEMDDDGNFYYVTNPEAKWDWYTIGGRWSGYFKKKPGAKGEIGRPGVMMEQVTDETLADVIKVSDIDWDAMDEDERKRRGDFYDEYQAAEKKPFVWDDKEVKALTEMTREEYVNRPISHATFAVLHDNVWYERGSMGWWAIVSDEKDPKDWDSEFRKLIESLDPEAEVTVVDCHI